VVVVVVVVLVVFTPNYGIIEFTRAQLSHHIAP
jgi:hypothetical protein